MTQTLQLTPQEAELVRSILASDIPNPKVAVFGSRATGRARPFSDLDLLIIEPPALSWSQRVALLDAFEASSLPFRVDLVEAARLSLGYAQRIREESVLL